MIDDEGFVRWFKSIRDLFWPIGQLLVSSSLEQPEFERLIWRVLFWDVLLVSRVSLIVDVESEDNNFEQGVTWDEPVQLNLLPTTHWFSKMSEL